MPLVKIADWLLQIRLGLISRPMKNRQEEQPETGEEN